MSSEYESGYESDTGPRDNPTCSNFDDFEPVKRVITAPIGVRRLNREGRAICRIVHAHDWKISDICIIFGGQIHRAVSRAIENAYKPPDNTLDDYDHVDAEFRKKYPPLGEESDDLTSLDSNESDSEESDMSFSPSTPPPPTTLRKQHDEDSDADCTSTTSFPSKKRPRSGTGDTAESFFHTAKKPRYETVSQSTQSRVNQTARRSSATLTRTGAKPSSSKSSSSSASSSSKEQDSPPPPPNRKSLKTPKVPSSASFRSVSKSSPTPPPVKKSFLLPLRSTSTSSEDLRPSSKT
ncbi:hypothetical protein B0H11DRAFT_2093083 [Mycena galericulata]|nr:hypothetical protein B0H11DRAFT_2093083 [Mycena galericulata]